MCKFSHSIATKSVAKHLQIGEELPNTSVISSCLAAELSLIVILNIPKWISRKSLVFLIIDPCLEGGDIDNASWSLAPHA